MIHSRLSPLVSSQRYGVGSKLTDIREESSGAKACVIWQRVVVRVLLRTVQVDMMETHITRLRLAYCSNFKDLC